MVIGSRNTLREDLEGLIRPIFRIRDNDTRHQVLDALSYDSVRSWKKFRKLIAEDLQDLTMEIEGGRQVGINKTCMQLLLVLNEMIWEKIFARDNWSLSVSL